MSTVTPFANGQLAFTAGKKPDTNPHVLHSRDWIRWNNGYAAGYIAARKAANKAATEAIEQRPLDSWVTEEATK